MLKALSCLAVQNVVIAFYTDFSFQLCFMSIRNTALEKDITHKFKLSKEKPT